LPQKAPFGFLSGAPQSSFGCLGSGFGFGDCRLGLAFDARALRATGLDAEERRDPAGFRPAFSLLALLFFLGIVQFPAAGVNQEIAVLAISFGQAAKQRMMG
jgi:hypothetical protein